MVDDEFAPVAEQFHEDVAHEFQVSLTMSIETRERLRSIQDELNERAGERLFTTNDVMRIALAGAARYHELASGDLRELEDVDEDRLLPLTDPVREVCDEKELLEP